MCVRERIRLCEKKERDCVCVSAHVLVERKKERENVCERKKERMRDCVREKWKTERLRV